MRLALTGFKAALRLVDDVDAALTAHDTAIAVTLLERAERVLDFHRDLSHFAARVRLVSSCPKIEAVNSMVRTTGIEPVTPTMST